MLDDGKLAENLGLVHFDQSLIDFGPGRDAANVPQLVRVLVKRSRLHFGDVLDASEKHEVCGEGFVVISFDEVTGLDARVVDELSAAPNERHELIIVQTPHAVTSGRLHAIRRLHFPGSRDPSPKNISVISVWIQNG